MLNGFILVVLQGARRMKDYVLYDNSCSILRLLILLFAVLAGFDLLQVVIAYLLSAVISSLVGLRIYSLVRRDTSREDAPPALSAVFRAVPGARLGDVFSAGTLIAICKNIGELTRNLTNVGIGKVVGTVELAHFRVAYIYMWSLQQLLGGLGRNLLPSMGVRLEKNAGDMHRFGRDLVKVALISGLMFIVVTALFCAVAPWVIRVLYGREYQESVPLVFLLAIGHLFLGFHVVIDVFYIYTRQLWLSVKINLALFLLIVFPVGYVLISRYGTVGGAIFLSFGMFVPVVHFLVIRRFLKTHERLDGGDGGDAGDEPLPGLPPTE
jgi:O-antigen/teichoic acid export membrane protein